MRKVVRLTESDLVRIVKRVIRESEDEVYDDNNDLIGHYNVGPDRLDSARFIPNQKGTEKGHSMGSNTPEISYKKPGRDSGMERLMAKDDFARLRPERMKPERMKPERMNPERMNPERMNNRRYDDLNENDDDDYDDDYTRERSFKDKNFKYNKSGLERTIGRFSLEHLIRLYGGENQIDSTLKKYRPFASTDNKGLLSFDDLVDYKGGYEEDEY